MIDAEGKMRALLVALASVMLVGATGCGASGPAQSVSSAPATAQATPTFTMSGVFDVFVGQSEPGLTTGSACKVSGSITDIATGTPVTIYSPDGKIVGTTALEPGTYVSVNGTTACKFAFTVDDVRDGLPTYSIQVGKRGLKVLNSNQAHALVVLSDGP